VEPFTILPLCTSTNKRVAVIVAALSAFVFSRGGQFKIIDLKVTSHLYLIDDD
jgi:hypothetical protein